MAQAPAVEPVPDMALKEGPTTPQQLPGLTVRRQKQIPDPVALAARLYRQVATDAMPEPGSGGWFSLSPDLRQLAFVFVYYSRNIGIDQRQVRIQSLEDGSQRGFRVAAWDGKDHGYGSLDWSLDGDRLIFASQGPEPGERTPYAIWSCRLDGTGLRRLTPPSVSARYPSLSPDRKRVAFVHIPPLKVVGDLCVMELTSRTMRRLAPGAVWGPARWSPDGKQLAFLELRTSKTDDRVSVISADGRGRRLLTSKEVLRGQAPKVNVLLPSFVWLPDGKGLLATVQHYDPLTHYIWKLQVDGSSRQLGLGGVLTASDDSRTLLLKMQDRYWLVELGAPPDDG